MEPVFEGPITDRRRQPLLRWFITYAPVVVTFLAGMSTIDPEHAKAWLIAGLIVSSLSGGSKGPAIFKGR